MGCDMKESLLLLSIMAVTVYLTVAAWEDYKTCEVTRWKHLIGGIPAILLLCTKYNQYSCQEYGMILAFSLLYVLAGYMGAYGMADGYVFMILTLHFGSIGGLAGIGIVILIMIMAAFSFLVCHVLKCVITHTRIRNVSGAMIPHIFVGYMSAFIGMIFYI